MRPAVLQPAPPTTFRTSVEIFETLDDLDAWLATEFSLSPLEEQFEWPSDLKRKVRARCIAPGMSKEMVELALGGLGHKVDREALEDGRIRETWELQIAGRTKRVFVARTIDAHGGSSMTAEPDSELYLFGQLPSHYLQVVFTDGRVTASERD